MSDVESPAPVKTEFEVVEDETSDHVLGYAEAPIKLESVLLYADEHETKYEFVIGPFEIHRPPTEVDHSHWEAARRALVKAGVDNKHEFLLRLFSSRLVLRDAADELLCAGCGQWSLTAAEQNKHQRAAHSSEHPRDYLQPNTSTTNPGNAFQAQPTTFIDQRENTSLSARPEHILVYCNLCQRHISRSLFSKHMFDIHSHTKAIASTDTTFKVKDNLMQREVVPNPTHSLSCDICTKQCSNKHTLKRHKLLSHKKYKALACDSCSKRFSFQSQLSEHMLVHNGSKPFMCHKCGKNFSYKGSLYEHMRIHDGFKYFACDKCDTMFSHESYLSRHKMLNHSGSEHILSNKHTLKSHKLVSHKEFKTLACENCSKRFSLKSQLSEHMLVHNGSKPFTCHECGKNYGSKGSLYEHMRIHDGFKSFACDKCNMIFTHENYLSRHKMLKHSGSKHILSHKRIKLFVCDKYECGKSFPNKRNLSRHIRLSHVSKSFVCDICDKKLQTKFTLSQHKLVHKGIKAFECDKCGKSFTYKCHTCRTENLCDKCGKSFKWESNLNKHMLIHSESKAKPFACVKCDKRFAHRYLWTKHMRIHNGSKPFECDECGKRFADKYKISQHILSHNRRKAS